MVYFGVDEYDDPMLTYYECDKGRCEEIYDLKCNRTCDHKRFDFGSINVVILQVRNCHGDLLTTNSIAYDELKEKSRTY